MSNEGIGNLLGAAGGCSGLIFSLLAIMIAGTSGQPIEQIVMDLNSTSNPITDFTILEMTIDEDVSVRDYIIESNLTANYVFKHSAIIFTDLQITSKTDTLVVLLFNITIGNESLSKDYTKYHTETILEGTNNYSIECYVPLDTDYNPCLLLDYEIIMVRAY